MKKTYRNEYYRPPSALKFMSLAALPKKGFINTGDFPDIVAQWKNCKPSYSAIKDFNTLTGIEINKAYHPLFLHTISFRLLMSVLTHPAFPEAIWSVLQVRNIMIQRRSLSLAEPFDLEVKFAEHRIVQKGLEFDLQTSISVSNDIVWESINTFYIRGKFGVASDISMTKAPKTPSFSHSVWNIPHHGGRNFGSLTGDYNGIHMWDWYAKMFGFKAAFSHPQRVLGQIFNKLHEEETTNIPLKIETWLKGPVYYGTNLELKVAEEEKGKLFSLHVNDEQRPAIIGRYSNELT